MRWKTISTALRVSARLMRQDTLLFAGGEGLAAGPTRSARAKQGISVSLRLPLPIIHADLLMYEKLSILHRNAESAA